MQRRRHSFVEACVNTATGMVVSYAASFVVYPVFDMGGDPHRYAAVTAIFTALSIARTYAVRRAANWIQHGRGRDT
jgi:hypothetical protein